MEQIPRTEETGETVGNSITHGHVEVDREATCGTKRAAQESPGKGDATRKLARG